MTGSRGRLGAYLLLILVAGLVLVPLLATVLGGFKSEGELRVNPFGWPRAWEWDSYAEILGGAKLWRSLMNSAVIAGFSVVLTLIVASMAAYVFAQVKFFGSRMLMNYFLAGLLFPAATAVLPLFIRVRDLGLLDSLWGVVLPQVAFSLGLSILLLYTFFRQLPAELWDAALVDGCGYLRFYWHVTVPLSRPILATVAVFALVHSWNAYLLPLVLLDSAKNYPWPLAIMDFASEYSIAWNRILAFITLSIIPAVAFFLLAQKQIIAGLTGGAVKG